MEFIENFMERNRNRPCFVYYPMALIHSPFQPTPDHPDFASHEVEQTNDTTYLPPMVRHMDRQVDRLVRKLDELGVRENTLVLFVGDNETNRKVTSRMGDR